MLLAWLLGLHLHAGTGGVHLLAETFPLLLHLRRGNAFLAKLAEIAHGLVGRLFRVRKNGVGLFVGLPQNPFALGFQLLLLFLGLGLEPFQFPAVCGDLFLLFLDRPLAGLKICQQILKGFILLRQMGSGLFDDIVRQP